MVDKRGQGLSLNVIIIAALALIVLVILVVVFTGGIGRFEKGVGEQGDTELATMRISYGTCRPTAGQEATFKSDFSRATSADDKELSRARFSDVLERCKGFDSKDSCESSGCRWPSTQ